MKPHDPITIIVGEEEWTLLRLLTERQDCHNGLTRVPANTEAARTLRAALAVYDRMIWQASEVLAGKQA